MTASCGQVRGMIERIIEEGSDFLVQDFVVGFEREHIVGIGLVDFAGDGFLAAHRIEGDDAAGQFELWRLKRLIRGRRSLEIGERRLRE